MGLIHLKCLAQCDWCGDKSEEEDMSGGAFRRLLPKPPRSDTGMRFVAGVLFSCEDEWLCDDCASARDQAITKAKEQCQKAPK